MASCLRLYLSSLSASAPFSRLFSAFFAFFAALVTPFSLPSGSTSPFQRNRACHGMPHRLAGALGVEVCGFELEVPLSGEVGVVDQHQMGIMLESFGLQFHCAPILFDKFGKDELQ